MRSRNGGSAPALERSRPQEETDISEQTISLRRRVFSGLAFTAPACALFCLNAARPAAAQTPAVGFNSGTVGVEDNDADVFQLRSKTGRTPPFRVLFDSLEWMDT